MIVQKELAKHVREAKHELKCLHLANDGWRIVLLSHAEQICNALNTPKAGPLDDLFHKFLGLESLSDKWSCGGNTLNGFVGVRGDIAHRGRAATYVTLEKLKDQLSLIDCAAKETDNAVREHIRTATAKRHQPWKIIL